VVRATECYRNNTVFRRDSFTLCGRPQRRFRSTANSLRLPAGGATTSALRSDVPCRADGASPGYLHPTLRVTTSPEGSAAPTAILARTISPAHLLQLAGSWPRTPSTDAIPVLRLRVASWSKSDLFNFQVAGTPFRVSQLPACHGDGPPLLATLLRAFHAETRSTRCRKDASCQHLQPTCCHEYRMNPAILERWAYAFPTPASAAALPTTRLCCLQNDTFHEGAG
jgi:hypothetical protein